jgi:hypothetical protein
LKYIAFLEEKTEIVQLVSKNSVTVSVATVYEMWSLCGSSTCVLHKGWVVAKVG